MGKSILVSSIIEQLQNLVGKNDDVFMQYFYCNNGNDDAQKTERILSQILAQLYAQVSSSQSLDLIDGCNDAVRRYLLTLKQPSGDTNSADSETYSQLTFGEAY